MEDKKRIKELEKQVDDLITRIIDFTFEQKNNKEKELIAFVQDLYLSLHTVNDYLTKEEIIFNLKEYIENFAKDNKLNL